MFQNCNTSKSTYFKGWLIFNKFIFFLYGIFIAIYISVCIKIIDRGDGFLTRVNTIGFPKMLKERGEKRDFLPELFEYLKKYEDIEIYLEKGYGSGMGFSEIDYLKVNPNIKFTIHEDIYKKDLVIVLKAPNDDEIKLMKKGSHLFSMLHYPTRELRNNLLKKQGINCFSMDSMVDDDDVRIFVNYKGTSWSAVKKGFDELKNRMEDFYSANRKPIIATIIGLGYVAQQAARALEVYSDKEFLDRGVPGVIVKMLPRTITNNSELLKKIFSDTDLLIDASKRPDPTKYIVPNTLIAYLPEYAVILDICADPYDEKKEPIQVKAIEGIPTGNLEKYIFEVDDEAYDHMPDGVDTSNRRVVVSCSAWPGIDPVDCMSVYGKQIKGFLNVICNKDLDYLNENSENLYERSLYRSTLEYFENNKK